TARPPGVGISRLIQWGAIDPTAPPTATASHCMANSPEGKGLASGAGASREKTPTAHGTRRSHWPASRGGGYGADSTATDRTPKEYIEPWSLTDAVLHTQICNPGRHRRQQQRLARARLVDSALRSPASWPPLDLLVQ